MKQIKRRIINIASYEKPTFYKKLKGMTAFILTTVLIMGLTPFISTYAADESHYQWKSSSENISYVRIFLNTLENTKEALFYTIWEMMPGAYMI